MPLSPKFKPRKMPLSPVFATIYDGEKTFLMKTELL